MLSEAFARLIRTDRPEIMNTLVACWIGHTVGPLWYYPEGFSIRTNAINKLDGVVSCEINFMLLKMKLEADDARFDNVLEEVIKLIQRVEPDCEVVR